MNSAHLKKDLKIFHISLILLIILIDLTPVISAQVDKPVNFYLYNSVDMEKEWPIFSYPTNYSLYGRLRTTPPEKSNDNYTYCPTNIDNFTYMHGTIGHWFSEPIYYSINTTLNISVNVWMKSQTNITNVSLRAMIHVPCDNGYHGYGTGIDSQKLSDQPKLFSFNSNFTNTEKLRNGGRFYFEFKWNYTPSENSSLDNVTFISFSGDMQSSFKLYLDSVRSEIVNYFIDNSENVIEINTKISDALGLTDIKEYSLSIIGPIENDALNERIIDINEYSINSNWTWDYGSVRAPSGNYTFILTVIDNSNNTWEDTITVYIEVIEERDNEDNIFTFLITPIIIVLIILMIYFAVKLKKSKKK